MTLMQRFALPPDEIYHRSFEIVDALLPTMNWTLDERQVVQRIVHATGDPQIATMVRFKSEAVERGVAVLQRGTPIFTDVQMVAAGINQRWRRALQCPVQALIEREGVEKIAEAQGITRSAAAVIQALPELGGAIVVIGNAPTALLALLDALDSGAWMTPELIIGVPVGFVATSESKEALWQRPYCSIIVEGTRGGSPVAAATVNALLSIALQRKYTNRDTGGTRGYSTYRRYGVETRE